MVGLVGPPRPVREETASGVRFGKYRLLREIAIGGMAKIYLASLDGPGGFAKLCVVKRVLPQHSQIEQFSKMFVTEARLAALLTHPNIVSVFDFGQIGTESYIAMEWVDGPSLETVMRSAFERKIVPGSAFAMAVAQPLCEALAYAHHIILPQGKELKLVHRDLTPGNVLLAHNGIVKLTDFGVAKAEVGQDKTSVGVVKGKFAYMSPEQVRGDVVDQRTDIYALGILMHELVTGQWLFRREQLPAMIAAVSLGNIPRPTSINPDVPEGLERIIMKALANKPDDRYQNARDMLTDIEQFRSSLHWSSGSQSIVTFLENVLPPPDPKRHEADPSTITDMSELVSSVSRVMDDARIEVVDDDDRDRHEPHEPLGLPITYWVAITVGVIATLALWAWILS